MRKANIIFVSILSATLFLPVVCFGAFTEPSNGEYTCQPIFQVNAVQPNILIILDNSGSMNGRAYAGNYDHNTRYYGYYEPYKKYSYVSWQFVRDTSGKWDGNFLNWAVMRRIDVARKVIMGGLVVSRTGTGKQTNIGEDPSGWNYSVWTSQKDTWGVTPYANKYFYFYVYDGKFSFYYYDGGWHYAGKYWIKVHKDASYPDEAGNFVDGNLAGVLQKVGSKARWGNEWFSYGSGNDKNGGFVFNTIDDSNITSMVTDIQNRAANTWTPLAEAYYTAVQYFKQEDVASSLDYQKNAVPNASLVQDPYYNGSEFVHCAKSFVILLTDGASTKDAMVPAFLKDFDSDGNDNIACNEYTGSNCDYGSGGTDYLDDIALYARTTDLRSTTIGKTELEGEQTMILYTIFAAFGQTNTNAENLLKDAAKNGGFTDKNGNNIPDLQSEWDADNDGVPDTYYKADDGYELETKLLQAINDILERAASGTAVSVLATSGEGEGNLVQAFFRPQITSGTDEIKWLGYLQSLWVDAYGNLREDTNQNLKLDVDADKVISHFLDPTSGDSKVKRFAVSASDPYPDTENDPYETIELDEPVAIWQAGKLLAERSADDRNIFTYLDKDEDGVVDETVDDPFDDLGEVVRFHTGSAAAIKPFLGVQSATWDYLGATHDERVTNLIQYIRGNDISGLRTRTFDYDDDGTDETWKLGDIVHSTPVSISKPPDNFHTIYSDESYLTFYNEFKNRETVVYVGANDGMLHAFTSWVYNSSTKQFTKPSGAPSGENIGDEIWAFIPQNILPHLKWLPDTDYSHVYYVDMKPKIFDAKILPDNTHYTDSDTDDNWGTFLLIGFNLGGGHIQAEEDFDYNAGTADTIRDFYPSYVMLDITEPRNPRLMWERTYTDLQTSQSIPAIVRVKDKWVAVFGSGPADCSGDSSKNGHVYVVDLKTGDPYQNGSNDWLFETGESKAFMNSPVSLDKNLNFNVDAIYIGETYLQGTTWEGKVYKITIPWADSGGNYDGIDTSNYSDNPLDATNPWTFHALFDSTRPVTASLALSVDNLDNTWIYGGTGRYLNDDDKSDTDTQYFFGIKDPFFNSNYESSYYHSYSSAKTISISDLYDVDNYTVTTTGSVWVSGSEFGSWDDLVSAIRNEDGWIRTLTTSKERILTKPSLLGGIVFAPSFIPNSDVCGFGGDSNLYGVYFETGTGFYESVFSDGTETVTLGGEEQEEVVDMINLGEGKSSSLGIHVGSEEGAKGFIQQSTGSIISESLNPAFNIKSSLKSWRER